MAFTQTDLDVIERAIATGELTVTFSDGRSVTYRSITELIKARDTIKAALSVSSGGSGTHSTYATFRKD